MKRTDALLAGTAAGGLGAVGAALFTQYVWGMQPCPWCVLQRLIFVAAAVAALLGLAWRSALGRRLAAVLMLGLAGCGIAAAGWQHFVAAKSLSCNLTLADRVMTWTGLDGSVPDVFMATASCADAAVKLLGLPYEAWSFLLFAAIALAAVAVIRRPT